VGFVLGLERWGLKHLGVGQELYVHISQVERSCCQFRPLERHCMHVLWQGQLVICRAWVRTTNLSLALGKRMGDARYLFS
jgi:hypothetical protein